MEYWSRPLGRKKIDGLLVPRDKVYMLLIDNHMTDYRQGKVVQVKPSIHGLIGWLYVEHFWI